TEVLIRDEDLCLGKTLFVKGVGLALFFEAQTVILKGVFSQTIKSDSLEKAGRDDAVGIDIVAPYRDGATFDEDSFQISHCALPFLLSLDVKNFTGVGNLTTDGSGGDHGGTHQQGAPSGRSLTTLEVAVGAGR